MSEFQYYEFLAIDRPLTPGEKAELRQLSTRARITASSFITVHHWGNFKGSPSRLMERYFDAHVYWAYWGTAVFMLRLPLEALVKETTDALTEDDCLWFKATPTHWIVTWHREESRRSGEVGWHSGRGWMARLAPLRDELLRGDLRGLYIGWLAALGQDPCWKTTTSSRSPWRDWETGRRHSGRWRNSWRWTAPCWRAPPWASRHLKHRPSANWRCRTGSPA